MFSAATTNTNANKTTKRNILPENTPEIINKFNKSPRMPQLISMVYPSRGFTEILSYCHLRSLRKSTREYRPIAQSFPSQTQDLRTHRTPQSRLLFAGIVKRIIQVWDIRYVYNVCADFCC